jgi:hypothetical protein
MKWRGALNWRDGDGATGSLGTFKDIEAPDADAAAKIVLDLGWDDRLDAAGCVPDVALFEEGEDAVDEH